MGKKPHCDVKFTKMGGEEVGFSLSDVSPLYTINYSASLCYLGNFSASTVN
jgi:hypothetical protein